MVDPVPSLATEFLFPPDLPDCNLDMVLDLLSSIGAAIKTGGGGVGIVIVEAAVSSSGIVGHEVKVLAASEDGVPEAPVADVLGPTPS